MKGSAALKTTSKGPRTDYKISVSLDHQNDLGAKVIVPWIQNGLLSVSSQVKSNKSEKHEIKFSADNLWLEPLNVAVRSPKIDIAFTENKIENQLFDWTIHKIDISGNPYSSKFPRRGILRGPFYLKTFTRPDQEIVLLSTERPLAEAQQLESRLRF
jgi:hypothetical protein